MSLKVKGIANTEKEICIYEFAKDGSINTYTKEAGYKTITKDEFDYLRKNPISASHLPLKKNNRDEDVKQLSMKKQMKAFDKEAKILKRITNGKINLYKTGSVPKTALQLFYSFKPPVPEPIEDYESIIIDAATMAANVFGIKYKGPGYKYDICSAYPGIMRSEHSQFAIGKGKLVTLTIEDIQKKPYFSYGVYHVRVSGINKLLFRKNVKEWYTHIELNRALELNYDLELIEDGEPNALLYEGKLINGAKLFAGFVDYIFSYKNKGFKCIKKYLNALWGTLGQINTMTINTKLNNSIYDDKEVQTILPIEENGNITHYNIECVVKTKRYDNDYARIMPFLLAKARVNISKIIEKNLDTVVYSHTDSVILKEPIKNVKTGNNIGDLVFEEYSECCEIINGNQKRGFTKTTEDVFDKLNKQWTLAKTLYKDKEN